MPNVDERRIRVLKKGKGKKGPVVYWMSRDQRSRDNWALLYAQELARKQKNPPVVVFCLVPEFLGATVRHYGFMLKGLEEVQERLKAKNIPFVLLRGKPELEIPKFIKKIGAGALVTDFDPLKIKRKWKKDVSKNVSIPFFEVDAHNIVPCRTASSKQEFAARTIRPKIHRFLDEFLVNFPSLKKHPYKWNGKSKSLDVKGLLKTLKVDRNVKEVERLKPGEKAAAKTLKDFISRKLKDYDEKRNDPNEDTQSNLSPYLHFGQISAQRVALEVKKAKANTKSKEAFLEELIVRRELSDNFCFFNKDYDKFNGFPDWAKKTLNNHKKDKRKYNYSRKKLEKGKTHDDLWNAAQFQMVKTGKMHGFMRMYWAKKILEWTKTPELALKYGIYLNDKYELDGRDPNGYVGVAWSIGGVHDRAWNQNPVYGKVRYMSYNGCKSKFDVRAYIRKFKGSEDA